MDAPHVRAGIKANEDMFNMVNGMTGLAPTTTQIPDKEPGVTFPLAGSCAGCERDATAGGRADLKKCSGCKLTRCVAPLRSYSLLRSFRSFRAFARCLLTRVRGRVRRFSLGVRGQVLRVRGVCAGCW